MAATLFETQLTKDVGIQYPIIGGAMYPCSNPELVAAVSEAGGVGIVQPLSLTYVYKYDFREGLRYIRTLTQKPIGLNLLVEKSSKKYLKKSEEWLEIALEEGVGFYITALGNPKWVVDQVKSKGGVVYHDVTSKKWALKAAKAGVDGFIAVNNAAGGHAGDTAAPTLLDELKELGKPVVCAGGISTYQQVQGSLDLGYAGVQLGTRFIASKECQAHEDYKAAICGAKASDIVLTTKISGVPVSVIKTPYIESVGTQAGWFAKRMLKHPKGKHWMRMFYMLKSLWQLKKSNLQGSRYKDYWQAGKSVAGIDQVLSVKQIIKKLTSPS